MMNVMVAGGAGYIGSHAVKQLIEAGHRVLAIDNLFRGHAQAVHTEAEFLKIDLAETQALADALAKHSIDCVMQFAALTYVGESVAEPLSYYDNNTAGTISLLKAMKQTGVKRLVFSSTAATYGEPEATPIVETMPNRRSIPTAGQNGLWSGSCAITSRPMRISPMWRCDISTWRARRPTDRWARITIRKRTLFPCCFRRFWASETR